MNDDQVKGGLKNVKGAIKEQVGKATGDAGLENRGKVDQAAGRVQGTYGDVKEDVKDAVRDDRATRRP